MMNARPTLSAAVTAACLLTLTGVAEAQDHTGDSDLRHTPDAAFLEGHGAWGVQFGETQYLPSGELGDYEHPFVVGPSFGGTAGVMLHENVALMASYDYTRARSSQGELDGVAQRIKGRIDYHTIVAGLRLFVPIGFGALRAELGGGVLLPYTTTQRIVYGDPQSQVPLMDAEIGTRVDAYSVGFGGQAALGYQFPFFEGFYGSVNVRYRLFESENSGERTVLTNWLDASTGARVDETIEYGDGAAAPSTNSVQDVRLQLAFGYQF